MMNREPTPIERLGNASAFGLVLIILVSACYLVYGIIRGDRSLLTFGGSEEIRPTAVVIILQPTLTSLRAVEEPALSASLSVESMTPLVVASPEMTPPPSETAIPAPTDTPLTTETPVPSPTSFPSSTPVPPTNTPFPTDTPQPTATPVPPSPTPVYLFYAAAAGPDFGRGCDGQYIFGYVRSASGNPIPGVRVWAYNESEFAGPPATTKEDPAGWYAIPISSTPTVWYVQVVDAGNNPLSPPIAVVHTGNFIPGSEACWHQVDFTRYE